MQQIAAETERIIVCDDATELKCNLCTVNNEVWQSLEITAAINTTGCLAENENMKQVHEPTLVIDHVSCTLTETLPDDDALKPLFYYLTSAIHSTVSDVANYKFGYYEMGESFSCRGRRAICTNKFSVVHHLVNDTELEKNIS